MTADQLKSLQAPLKEQYKADPASAMVTPLGVAKEAPVAGSASDSARAASAD